VGGEEGVLGSGGEQEGPGGEEGGRQRCWGWWGGRQRTWKATAAGFATGTTTTALHRFGLRLHRAWHSASACSAVSPLPLVSPGGGTTKHVPWDLGKHSVFEPTKGSYLARRRA